MKPHLSPFLFGPARSFTPPSPAGSGVYGKSKYRERSIRSVPPRPALNVLIRKVQTVTLLKQIKVSALCVCVCVLLTQANEQGTIHILHVINHNTEGNFHNVMNYRSYKQFYPH